MPQLAPSLAKDRGVPAAIKSEELVPCGQAVLQQASGRLFIQVAVLCSAVAFLDGVDSTSISVAAPLITAQLHLLPTQLGIIFSSALLGATIGAVTFGRLADRVGRKRMLIVATLLLGVFTLATSLATSLGSLLAIRFLAGIGLGGATPCFIALATEFAPPAHRARVAGFIWTAFPLGTVIGTFISAYLVSVSGWQAIFVAGGVVPLFVVVAMLIWLPESIQFLGLRNGVPAEPTLRGDNTVRGLLGASTMAKTLLLWFAFWIAFGTLVAVFSFAPTIMRQHGIPLPRAAVALGLSGIAGLVGSFAAGVLIEKVGVKAMLMTAFLLGGVATACLGYAPGSLVTTGAVMSSVGLLVGGVAGAGLLAFAAVIYPTAARSTGVGSAMGAGRFGQVSMPLAISAMLAAGLTYNTIFIVIGVVVALGAMAILQLERLRR